MLARQIPSPCLSRRTVGVTGEGNSRRRAPGNSVQSYGEMGTIHLARATGSSFGGLLVPASEWGPSLCQSDFDTSPAVGGLPLLYSSIVSSGTVARSTG